MSDAEPPPGPDRDSADPAAAARRRRLAEVFGEVLPEETSDDRAEEGSSGQGDEWLRNEVPPHHGGH